MRLHFTTPMGFQANVMLTPPHEEQSRTSCEFCRVFTLTCCDWSPGVHDQVCKGNILGHELESSQHLQKPDEGLQILALLRFHCSCPRFPVCPDWAVHSACQMTPVNLAAILLTACLAAPAHEQQMLTHIEQQESAASRDQARQRANCLSLAE